jgi:hypothetical protein
MPGSKRGGEERHVPNPEFQARFHDQTPRFPSDAAFSETWNPTVFFAFEM